MMPRILTLILILALSPSWIRFPMVWAQSREHGFVAAGVSVWLIWRAREQFQGWAPLPLVLPVLAMTSVLWWIGLIGDIQVLHLLLAPILLFLWAAATAGTRAVQAAIPALLVFLLAIPVWEVLVPVLQSLTVLFNQIVLHVIGLQATIRDTSIVLPVGVLEVADTCSGLNFLLVGTTMGAAYATLLVNDRKTRWQIVMVSAAVSIIANWLRVLGLVLIAGATKMQSSLMKDHEVYGWSIFVAALVVFFAVARRLEARAASTTVEEKPALAIGAHLTRESPATRQLIVVSGAAMLGPLLLLLNTALPPHPAFPAGNADIAKGAQWHEIQTAPARSWDSHFEGANRRLTTILIAGNDTVRIERFQYLHAQGGRGPAGTENKIAPDSLVIGGRIVGPLDTNLRMVRESAVRDATGVTLVWSWFAIGGIETPSRPKAKLLQVLAALRRRSDAEVVLVSTRCPSTGCTEASESLYALVTGRAAPTHSSTDGHSQ